MKIFKFLLVSAAVFCLSLSVAQAEVVTVTGYGADENSAINDAKRNAVSQVVGTVLKSQTEVQKLTLVMDAIKTRTQGYITHFVDVSSEPNSSLMKDVELVMSLNDPGIAVVVEYYGDDGGETFKKYPAMTAAAIREELIQRGFTHVLDSTNNAEYVILGKLTVNKSQAIKLPSWGSIGSDEYKKVDTGLSKTTATLDCKIKKIKTNEVIGEFHVSGDSMSASENDIQTPAVSKMASSAAQEVRKIFNREASKAFYDDTSISK